MAVVENHRLTDQILAQLQAHGLKPVGEGLGKASTIETDHGFVFVKLGTGGAKAPLELLQYEKMGLEHLRSCANEHELKIPKPWFVGEIEDNHHRKNGLIVMEYVDLNRANNSCLAKLGRALANMHLKEPSLYDRFGFPMDGCCGALAQPNNAEGRQLNWVEFYREFRLGYQLRVASEQYGTDVDLLQKGAQLMKHLPDLFSGLIVEDIRPSVLHGDLWSGNMGAVGNVPTIFDPACYYGHSEADLGIANMFGGFGASFFNAYHSVIPKQPGFEKRALLYELHHHLNHLNMFGTGYRSGVLRLMEQILS